MISMEEIYQNHSKMIYCFLLSKTGNPDLSEELTQETFYQAVRSSEKFKGESSVATWLCAIAKNVWFTYCRKSKETGQIEDVEDFLEEETLEGTMVTKWDTKEVLKYLHQMKEPMKEVIYLRLIGNLSFRDIGEIMGKTENWARVNFYRGKEKLIEEVKKHEPKDTL